MDHPLTELLALSAKLEAKKSVYKYILENSSPLGKYHCLPIETDLEEVEDPTWEDRVAAAMNQLTDTNTVAVGLNFESLPEIFVAGKPYTEYTPKTLAAVCTPSPYGDLKTATTKVDPTVRQALECKDITLSAKTRAFLSDCCQEISATLYEGRAIVAEVDKINVYGPGGFFKIHQDTPRPDRVGTLVFEVSSEYTDGGFQLCESV